MRQAFRTQRSKARAGEKPANKTEAKKIQAEKERMDRLKRIHRS